MVRLLKGRSAYITCATAQPYEPSKDKPQMFIPLAKAYKELPSYGVGSF